MSLQRNVTIEESYLLLFPQTTVSESKVSLFWHYWKKTILDWKVVKKQQFTAQWESGLLFPEGWPLPAPTSRTYYTMRRPSARWRCGAPCSNIIGNFKTVRSNLGAALAPQSWLCPLLSVFQTHLWDISETEHHRGEKDFAAVCPIYNLHTSQSLHLLQMVGKRTGRRGFYLVNQPLRWHRCILFPVKVVRKENHVRF